MRGAPSIGARGRVPNEGTLEVFVADEQDAEPIDVPRWAALAENVLTAQGIRGEAELSLLFVAEEVIADLNERFMATEGSTDVLAFPMEDDLIEVGRWPDTGTSGPDRKPGPADEAPLLLGDVVVCPSVAARNAPGHAGTYDDEIALLVVHGILHVLGMDHYDEAEAAAMQKREQELLDQFHHEQ